ncbi:hypothetical protein QOT17_013297 [Balamuthia mandrillaris]
MIQDLPPELQLECLKWLGGAPGRDWLHCCLTSKFLLGLCHDAALWRYFCRQLGQEGRSDTDEPVKDWKEHFLHCIRNHLELFEDCQPETLSLSQDKLTVLQQSSAHGHIRCRSRHKWASEKHYFEVIIKDTHNQIFIGIVPVATAITARSIVGHGTAAGWSVIPYTGRLLGNGGKQKIEPLRSVVLEVGDVIGVYLDVDAGDLLYFQNEAYLVGLQGCPDIREQKPYYAAASLMFRHEEATFRFPPSIPPFVQQHLNHS